MQVEVNRFKHKAVYVIQVDDYKNICKDMKWI